MYYAYTNFRHLEEDKEGIQSLLIKESDEAE